MLSDLNMSYGKMSDFVSFPLPESTLVIKLRNFDFESYWNILIFFDKKNDVRFEYVLSNSVWFGLSFVDWDQFSNKLRNPNFKLYWNSLIFFQLRNMLLNKNVPRFFLSNCIFWHYYRNCFKLKMFLMNLRYIETLHWNFVFKKW